MRNKKIFSFDEIKDAEDVILNGFPNGVIDYSKMYLVAKYFRDNFKYGAIRLERELIRFCKSQSKNFNPVVESESIKKWIKSAMMYELRKIDSVTISQKEIDFLKGVEIPKDRKLLFMTLIMAKALKKRSTKRKKSDLKVSDNYYIHYSNFLDIIRLSKLRNVTEVELANIFYKYKDFLTLYNAERELIRVDFVDKDSDNGITIDDLSKTSEYYEVFFGNNKAKSYCANCGKEIVKNSNKQKYCKECSQKLRKEQKRVWIKNARQKVGQ